MSTPVLPLSSSNKFKFSKTFHESYKFGAQIPKDLKGSVVEPHQALPNGPKISE